MNILIVDGEQKKVDLLQNCISNYAENVQIRWLTNYRDAVNYISQNHDQIDILFLDWTFPMNNSFKYSYGMGSLILQYIKEENYNIKTYMYTRDKLEIDQEEYPFVKGLVPYNHTEDELDLSRIFPESNIKRLSRCIKKPTESRYQKKKSSTPWWIN